MTNNKVRIYSRYSRKAVGLMGKMICLYRKERKMAAQDLADRAGISRITLRKIENGDMNCEIGIVFEVAALVGLKLFETDCLSLDKVEEKIEDKMALLPTRIRNNKGELDDKF